MRDYLFLTIIFGLLPICFLKPYIGILAWTWISLMNPHRLTWGVAYKFPTGEVIAVATLMGFVFSFINGKISTSSFLRQRETILLFLLWCLFTLTCFSAISPDVAWIEWERVSKILLMTIVSIFLINDQKKLRYFLIVIALSIGFYGFKGGVFSIFAKGESRVFGPSASFIADNNALALALNMILPILLYFGKEERDYKLKILLGTTFFFSVLGIIFTYSRGGFLGLLVVCSFLFLKAKLSRKMMIVMGLIMLLPVVASLIPGKWYGRIDTITDYKKDGSAMGRIEAWKMAWNLALDRPLTGGGFRVVDNDSLYNIYNPKATHRTGVHSAYFEVLAENGFITLGIFLMLMISSLLSLRKIRRNFKRLPSFRWICNYCHMIEISIIAYAVCGVFLQLAHFDLFYDMIAVVIILKTLASKYHTTTAIPERGN